MWCLFSWDILAQNSRSIHLFVLSAPRQEFTFPWKGLAGEPVRPGSLLQFRMASLFPWKALSAPASLLRGDANVAIPLDTQWVLNGLLHGQAPKTAGKPSRGLEAFPEDLLSLQLAVRVFGVTLPCSHGEVGVMRVGKSGKRCCRDLRAEHLTSLLSLQEWWCATGLSSWASASRSCASSTRRAGPLSNCAPRSGDSATWGRTTCGKAAFLEACPAFRGSWRSPCLASGSVQLQALLPFAGEGDFWKNAAQAVRCCVWASVAKGGEATRNLAGLGVSHWICESSRAPWASADHNSLFVRPVAGFGLVTVRQCLDFA